MPSASCRSTRSARSPPPAPTYAVRPYTASDDASARSAMSHAGHASPSTTCVCPSWGLSTWRPTAAMARSRRRRTNAAKSGSSSANAAYPSPSAQMVRVSQYDASESPGSGSSTGSTRVECAVRLHPQQRRSRDVVPRPSGDTPVHGAARGLVATVHVTELLPVTDVYDGGPCDVIGVVRALPVRVGGRVVRSAAQPHVARVARLGIGPQDADRRVLLELVRLCPTCAGGVTLAARKSM